MKSRTQLSKLAEYYFEISSFCGPKAMGNRHKVFIFSEEDTYLEAQQHYCTNKGEGIHVFLLLGYGNQAKLCFYQNKFRIKRCGSGTLAAMAALRAAQPSHKYLHLVSDCEIIQIINNSQKDIFSYVTQSLPLHSTFRPDYSRILEASVSRWLETEEENGYLIAVLNSEKAVQDAAPDLSALCTLSRRALIITAITNPKDGFVLRYFAPQYGNNEDAATGSANAIIAPFWFFTLARNQLESKQLSHSGGHFLLSVNDPPQYKAKPLNTMDNQPVEDSSTMEIPPISVQVGGRCIIHHPQN